jgi:hypothetical protein
VLTAAQKEAYAKEVLDKEKIQLVCAKHNYLGSNKVPQPRGCKDCWMAYYWYMIATTPPELRRQRVEEAYQALKKGVDSWEKGKWDFEPFDRVILEDSKNEN